MRSFHTNTRIFFAVDEHSNKGHTHAHREQEKEIVIERE